MSNTIGLPIKTGFIIENDTYKKSIKKDDGRGLDVEIGDIAQPGVFQPQFKAKFFNNLINYSARYNTKGKSGTVTRENNRLKMDIGDEVVEMFETVNGFEIGVTLKSKPTTNIFQYTLNVKDVEFWYQDFLENDENNYRPDNVQGSYAVYATRRPNGSSDYDFKSGKVGHIFRPYAEDANGARVWCDLNITGDIMSVTVPQSFLDGAVYPVFIDPDFGYTTAGGSDITVNGVKAKVFNQVAQLYAATAGQQIDNISAYVKMSAGTGLLELGVYDFGVGTAASGATLNCSADISIDSTTPSWITTANVDSAITDGNNYSAAFGNGRGTGGNIRLFYDAPGGTKMAESSNIGALAASFVHDDGGVSQMYSVYATAGAVPGPPIFSGPIPNQTFARTSAVSIPTGSYFTDPDTFSAANLPAFLSINTSTGEITNTSANVNGTYTGVTVTCTNAQGSDTSNAFDITIQAQLPVLISAINNKVGNKNNPITPFDASTKFNFADTFAATGLPAGLSIDTNTGIISGTPTLQQLYAGVYITATNADGPTDSNTFQWDIQDELPIPTISSVNSGNLLQRNQNIIISGTKFEASQGTGTVTFNGVSLSVVSWNDTDITVTVPAQGFVFGALHDLVVTNNSGYDVTVQDKFIPEPGYSYATSSLNYSQLPSNSFLYGTVAVSNLAIGDQVMYQTSASPSGTPSVDDQMVAVINGATASGDYTFNYLINDVSDLTVSSNGTAVVTLQGSDGDITAPSWVSSPAINNITTTSVTAAATINEPGAIYVVVVPQLAATPTPAQIKAGLDSAGAAAIGAASATATTSISASIATLSEATNYKACFVAEDDELTPNIQSSATIVNFTTASTVDQTPPTFLTGPTVTQVTQTTALLNATIDEPGTIYWGVIPQYYANPAPSDIANGFVFNPDEVEEAMIAFGSGATIEDIIATSLPAGTALKACFAAKDASSNMQVNSTVINFTTSAAGTSRSVTDTLVDSETGAAIVSTLVDYQLQSVWGTVVDSGQLTTDANGGFTVSNLNAAAGAARFICKDAATGLISAQADVTVTEA